jgi:hypothetical protein
MGTLLTSALKLAARGLHIFPCRPGDKRPATPNGCKDATTDASKITAWWRASDFNIGVATGAASKIMVVDVDNEDAEAELAKLERKFGELPPSVESVTARGRHIFFQWPGRDIRNSAGRIAPGIDIRGEGGFVIVPPSLHPTGKRYAWSVDSAGTFAAAPEWLLCLISKDAGSAPFAEPEDWAATIREGAGNGCRNDSMARLAGMLINKRLDLSAVLEIAQAVNQSRYRPPLPQGEITSIVVNIAAAELRKRTV